MSRYFDPIDPELDLKLATVAGMKAEIRNGRCRACAQVVNSFYEDAIDFSPSTNLDDAWVLVEYAMSQGCVVFVKGDGLRTYPGALRYTAICSGPLRSGERSDANTPALAVSKAIAEYFGV